MKLAHKSFLPSIVFTTCLCLIFAFFFLANKKGFAQTQTSNSANQTSNFTNLKLEISTTKHKFVESEAIPFIMKLKNETREPIIGHTAFDLTSHLTYLRIRRPDGSEIVENHFSATPKSIGLKTQTIAPGEKFENKDLLRYKLNEMLPQTGKYEIQAMLIATNGIDKAYSNTISIEITPASGIDLAALNFIKTSPAYKIFLGKGGTGNVQAIRDYEIFAEDFASSVYADYAAFSLGLFYLTTRDYRKAEKYFRKLKDKENFHYRERAKKYLEEIEETATP